MQSTQLTPKQEFVGAASPTEWLAYSEALADAAELLCAAPSELRLTTTLEPGGLLIDSDKGPGPHLRTYLLLAGLALENVLKGIMVALDPSLVATGTLSRCLHTHQLDRLAESIPDLDLTTPEAKLLQVCQSAVPYWGRYPIPLSVKRLQPAETADRKLRDCFRELHHRLCKRLYESIKGGWVSGIGFKVTALSSCRYGESPHDVSAALDRTLGEIAASGDSAEIDDLQHKD